MNIDRMSFISSDEEPSAELQLLGALLSQRGWSNTETPEPAGEQSNAAGPVARPLEAAPPAPPATVANRFVITPDRAEADPLLRETAKHLRSIGQVNILIAGRTGVGKSTLINAVFGERFAVTAAGRPVTQAAEWFTADPVPLRLLDTKGLEAKDYAATLQAIRSEIEKNRAAGDARDQLHLGWVCIASPSSRIEDCDIDVLHILNKHKIPAIVVLTKDDEDPEFHDIVRNVLTARRAAFAAIVPLRALARRSTPAFGLDDLVRATYAALPDGHRAAFAAAQKVDRDLTRAAAEEYVNAATMAAAATAAIPLPFADMAALAPIQAGMLAGISTTFGLSLDRAQMLQLLTTALGGVAASLAGRWAIGSAVKFIPGPGSVLGTFLNAAIAGTMTRSMGRSYINFLYSFMEKHGRLPNTEEILQIFPGFYKAAGEAASG